MDNGEELWGEAEFGPIGESEVAAAMRSALAQLPVQQRNPYKDMGNLVDAIKKPEVSGPGLYVIKWNNGGKEQAYHGKAVDLKQRLMQHHLCTKMLSFSVDNHQVSVAKLSELPMKMPLTMAQKAALRKREKDINTYIRNKHRNLFTNQRKELEVALLGESWT